MSRDGFGPATPDKSFNPFVDLCPRGSRKRKQVNFASAEIIEKTFAQHTSASPSFKKMPACRFPPRHKSQSDSPMDQDQLPTPDAMPTAPRAFLAPPTLHNVPPVSQASSVPAASTPALINPDFLQSLDKKMDLLTSGMLSIFAKVNQQGKDIEKNGLRISEQLLAVDANARSIAEIFNRLEDLAASKGGGLANSPEGPLQRGLPEGQKVGQNLANHCQG